MNDTELDQLLDAWQVPTPRPSLRDGVRERFPHRERLGLVRPLRWAAAILLVCAALAVVTMAVGEAAQSGDSYADSPIVRFINHVYENFLLAREVRGVESLMAKIKESDPQVYVDGRLIGPPEYGPAKTINVQVPDEGLYSMSLFRYMRLLNAVGRPTGWNQAGHIHDNVIEFQAGSKQVRIECNKAVVDEDRPVFAMRRR